MSTPLPALDRARAHFAAGRPDLARDTLQGYLYTLHLRGEHSEPAYLLLGEVLFSMKDFPRAGAAWLLTERDDDDAQFAIAAFHDRYGKLSHNVLKVVKPHAPSELYPPKVQARLLDWNYRYLPYRSRNRPRSVTDKELEQPTSSLRPIEAGCIIMVIAGVVMTALYLYMSLRR